MVSAVHVFKHAKGNVLVPSDPPAPFASFVSVYDQTNVVVLGIRVP